MSQTITQTGIGSSGFLSMPVTSYFQAVIASGVTVDLQASFDNGTTVTTILGAITNGIYDSIPPNVPIRLNITAGAGEAKIYIFDKF